jgi:hypothetical protein
MKVQISKVDLAVVLFLTITFGWLLGRFTEAIAVGNIKLW